MQVQVNTSNGIENKDALERWANAELKETLNRFRDDVTRVEVHLSDENTPLKPPLQTSPVTARPYATFRANG